MTDLERELVRQIHELDKELKELRERVAVMESYSHFHQPQINTGIIPHPIKGWEVT